MQHTQTTNANGRKKKAPQVVPTQQATTSVGIKIKPPALQLVTVPIVGVTSLIVHKFSAKVQQDISDRQQGRHLGARVARNPEAEYEDSLYHCPDGSYGFPAGGIKRAMVDAGSFTSGVTKVAVRGAVHVVEDMVPIVGCNKPQPRNGGSGDPVRLARGIASISYRAEFPVGWQMQIPLRFNNDIVSLEELVNLLALAGFHIGLGDWRPQRSGNHGMFQVEL